MTSGIATWHELGPLDGDVLAILNSPPGDEQAVAALFDRLQRRMADATRLHVIALPEWRRGLEARGVPDDRLLLSADAAGADLELNHFLESPPAVLWVVEKHFAFVVGSAPYAVYNDEVKEIFERRLAVLLGNGRFLAHTLPNEYVFVLDLPALLLRFGRRQKLEHYQGACRALVTDLHRRWTELGRPAASDDLADGVAAEALRRHLGPELLAFDEASPIPLARPDLGVACADLVVYFRDVLLDHDQRLRLTLEAVSARDALIVEVHAERVAAVNLRDAIIDTLRHERETLLQRWRRKLRERL